MSGTITDLTRQTPFKFEINGKLMFTYRADATYKENGQVVVEDVKGGDSTPLFKLKKKIIQESYGIEIKEIRN
jgi:hypothetical protein